MEPLQLSVGEHIFIINILDYTTVLEKSSLVLQDAGDPSDGTYELCYNHACFLIGQGNLRAAEEKLKQAESKRLLAHCFLSVRYMYI